MITYINKSVNDNLKQILCYKIMSSILIHTIIIMKKLVI